MEITTLCAVVAVLRVRPDRSQFFQYESVALSCGQQETSPEWRVMRNTSKHTNQECSGSWGGINKSHCFTDALYPSDTGVYWCESAAGECCGAVSITVTRGSVKLESPALPVMEGGHVTLSCRQNMASSSSSSNLTADFYKDGRLIGSSSTGNISLHSVSKADEGLYKCNISGAGESPGSWLTVRGHPDPPPDSHTHSPLPVVVVGLSLVSLVSLVSVLLLCLWRSYKGEVDPDVSYTDVTIVQGVQPKQVTDVDAAPTFYSTVKPGPT